MKDRMNQLEDELDKINIRIEQIQRGHGGYGSRAHRGMNMGSDYSGGSRGSRNSSNNSAKRKPQVANARYVSPLQKKSQLPSYMRTKGQSQDRSAGSGARNQSSTYVPIHLRGSEGQN